MELSQELRKKLDKLFQGKEAFVKELDLEEMTDRERKFFLERLGKTETSLEPPCSQWKIWIGNEVEGSIDIGEPTLFIRDLLNRSFSELAAEVKQRKITRVFFTEEFNNWPIIRDSFVHFLKVCKAHYIQGHCELPPDIAKNARIYWKCLILPETMEIKIGDQICVGHPFREQIFEWGTKYEMTVADYEKDEKLA